MREYFHVNYVATLSAEYGLSSREITEEYIAEIRTRWSSEEGAFSAKIHWLQMNQLVTALRRIHSGLAPAPAPQLIEASLPRTRYLFLTRRDKARQAISMFRAMRSDQWWEFSGPPELDGRQPKEPDPAPDFLSIHWFEQHLMAEDAEWRRYFEVFGIAPFVVVYEDLVAAPHDVLRAVFDWLGMSEIDMGDVRPRIRRQADADTERTLAEYLSLRDSLPPIPAGWRWSFRRRGFGSDDETSSGPPTDRPRPADEVTPL
jgi:LPS sulfotransferase NodH